MPFFLATELKYKRVAVIPVRGKPLFIAYAEKNCRTRFFLKENGCSPFLILSVIVLFSVFCLSIILGWVDTKAAGDSFLMVLKMAGLVSVLGIYLLLPGMIYVNTEAEKKPAVAVQICQRHANPLVCSDRHVCAFVLSGLCR
nr:hypothetical protein [Pantoea ananatis]